jgi:hypothetical protein
MDALDGGVHQAPPIGRAQTRSFGSALTFRRSDAAVVGKLLATGRREIADPARKINLTRPRIRLILARSSKPCWQIGRLLKPTMASPSGAGRCVSVFDAWLSQARWVDRCWQRRPGLWGLGLCSLAGICIARGDRNYLVRLSRCVFARPGIIPGRAATPSRRRCDLLARNSFMLSPRRVKRLWHTCVIGKRERSSASPQ